MCGTLFKRDVSVSVLVLEKVQVGTKVGVVAVEDGDSLNTNGGGFTFTQLSDYGDIFNIDSSTGVITMAQALDRDATGTGHTHTLYTHTHTYTNRSLDHKINEDCQLMYKFFLRKN